MYGGAGIFDGLASFLTRLFTSNVAKELGKKAIDVGKNVVLDAGKKLIEKGVTRVLTPKTQSALQKHVDIPMQYSSPDIIAKKVQSILSRHVNQGFFFA